MNDESHTLSDAAFEIGDTVSLKGDIISPKYGVMTVISIEDDSVNCAWTVRGDVKSRSFPIRALKKASAPLTLEELITEATSKAETENPALQHEA